jgi:hypothetical protein
MSPERIDRAYFSSDIREFIVLLHQHGVRYVVVGGEAVIHYGHARLTGDIDFLNRIDGVSFPEAWTSHVTVPLEVPDGSVSLHFLGLDHLIRNKEAAGRPKDLDDLAHLKSRH